MKDHFVALRVGLFDHVEDGRMTPSMFVVLCVILKQLDYETGIWRGSAPKLHAALGGQTALRTIQFSLNKLCEEGYLKSFHKQGERKNYLVAVNKYPVRFGKRKGHRLDAGATTDPKRPIYALDTLSVQEESATPTQTQRAEHDVSATTAQRERNHTATTVSPNARIPDTRYQKPDEERERVAKAEIVEQEKTDSLSISNTEGRTEKQVDAVRGSEQKTELVERAPQLKNSSAAEDGYRRLRSFLASQNWPITARTEKIVRDHLKAGHSPKIIGEAVLATMEGMPKAERQPGLYLAQNLPGHIELMLRDQRAETAEQARDRLERELYAASRAALAKRDKAEYERIRQEYRDKVGGSVLFGEYDQMVA